MRCHVPGRSAYPTIPCVAALLTVLAVAPPPCPCTVTEPPARNSCSSITLPPSSGALPTWACSPERTSLVKATAGQAGTPQCGDAVPALPAALQRLLVDDLTH